MGLGRCVVTHIICTEMQKKISCTVVFNLSFNVYILPYKVIVLLILFMCYAVLIYLYKQLIYL